MKNIYRALGVIAAIMLIPRRATNPSEELSFLGQQGLPRGIRNNNPGNIRITDTRWQGKIPNAQNRDGAFEQFQSYKWGIGAMTKLLINYMNVRGLRTLTEILNTYAPKSENNTNAYIQTISNETGIHPNTRLTPSYQTMQKLVISMARVENGRDSITAEQFRQAWQLL